LAQWQKDINHNLLSIAPLADRKISVSKWLQALLKSDYGIETDYIPNGIDVVKCEKASAEIFVKKYNLKDFIIFTGGYSDIKNACDYIHLAQSLPKEKFILIGDLPEPNYISDKIKIGVPHNLILIGNLSHSEVLNAIAASKLFIITSKSEGLPTSLMEAMVMRKNVVGPYTTGIHEVIHSDDNGYLYRPGDIEDLIYITQLALNNKSKGENARERILSNYDWRKVAPQIDLIYSNLLCRN
jgi:glycosyltransferase involved in cell wall biosynthesis